MAGAGRNERVRIAQSARRIQSTSAESRKRREWVDREGATQGRHLKPFTFSAAIIRGTN